MNNQFLGKLISSTKATCEIELKGVPNSKKTKLDTIEGCLEDSFSLETFQDLIIQSFVSDKDFILARVLTGDPGDATKFFPFYYPAFSINKAIFKIDRLNSLLYRMRARNPLNNMQIVGDIYYYRVTAKHVKQILLQVLLNQDKDKIEATAYLKKVSSCERLVGGEASKNTHRRSFSEGSKSKKSFTKDSVVVEKIPAAQDQKAIEIKFTAKFFGTDSDFLSRRDIREYFEANALTPEDFALYAVGDRLPSNNPTPTADVDEPAQIALSHRSLWQIYRQDVIANTKTSILFHGSIAVAIAAGILLFTFLATDTAVLYFILALLGIFMIDLIVLSFCEMANANDAMNAAEETEGTSRVDNWNSV